MSQGLLEETDIVVGGFFGSRSPPGGLAKVHVAVCTIEKGNNIVNRLLEAGEIDQVNTTQHKLLIHFSLNKVNTDEVQQRENSSYERIAW